jgi:putative beta-lysine N-acetyltransferase
MSVEKDKFETLAGSKIQHGEYNDRIYLMKLARPPAGDTVEKLDQLAERENYSKIFAKIPCPESGMFLEHGYREEARVPGFYNGQEDGCFLARYLDPARAEETNRERHEQVMQASFDGVDGALHNELPEGLRWRECDPADAEAVAGVYREVFETYPFPIHDPAYIRKTMETHVIYFGVWKGDKLVALSSSEMDEDASNVEMTDFATLPEARKQGIGVFLLHRMDERMTERGIKTGYTIARAVSFGMNITFARCGYEYAGRLINNTNISGNFESMNVWHKPLAAAQ